VRSRQLFEVFEFLVDQELQPADLDRALAQFLLRSLSATPTGTDSADVVSNQESEESTPMEMQSEVGAGGPEKCSHSGDI